MARYIENLNECTDPTSGDYLWIVDASASSSDKDRKVNVGKFAQLAGAAFTGQVTSSAADGASSFRAPDADLGSGTGAMFAIGRNQNASTPAPGALVVGKVNSLGNAYLWPDDSGIWRTQLNATVNSTNRNSGTVVGTQTSMLSEKDLLSDGPPETQVVAERVRRGAAAVRLFQYKPSADENGKRTGARPYGGEEFSGVVVDYAPEYGMDKDAEHPAGKSLNEVTVMGDLLVLSAALADRVDELTERMERVEGRAPAEPPVVDNGQEAIGD